ncbi:SMC-Scp complex subunit ScpB [Conexibacter sp. JD483]|uniref:SMC-Scp complex subunit ScpB n=1 Tax=unclassified Conexibacter TaxID=2627773 RepID=UPI00271BB608|nr:MULTISPECIES: SMC-Scp complex subunit ScpB [unclassified Conexibacter]MDO8184592.1 SMC-Scp complex subunit ScpB [Conexibacter sp. CPCC 205706]MDO8197898.1 SMC-Scp complex subunit ScpB [Conexibacter sp. CPCC 205762]MDR9370137.1 SMC-Scp complex subunit ScpB [Conexibacter sp. JD483]
MADEQPPDAPDAEAEAPAPAAPAPAAADFDTSELERLIEALLFLSSDPVSADQLADAADADVPQVEAALRALGEDLEERRRGIVVRELAGGFVLASNPLAEDAARRLFGKPRTPPLTPAQAETLAVVAYLQPVSRPEIARIRGVNAESAAATLIERGVIEEGGRSQFGAVLYRTTDLFLRLFGLRSLDDMPDVSAWDPSPEVAANIRDRLLRAGEARLGVPTAAQPAEGRTERPGGAEAAVPAGDALGALGADVPPEEEPDQEPAGADVIPISPPQQP